jgi:hypothetical protein
MLILVIKKKKYWIHTEPIKVTSTVSIEEETLNIKKEQFKCVELKIGTKLLCSWIDNEESIHSSCKVIKVNENTVEVEFDDETSSESKLEYIRIPNKNIDKCTVDLEKNLKTLFPEALQVLEKDRAEKK